MRPVASPTMTGADDGNDPALAADERAALIAAHERRVDALRNSAQYRVGELVIASARSPRRLVRLPVDLWRLRKELLAENLIAPLAPVTPEPARQVVVATILDEFSHQAFAPEWDQRPLGATSPADQLTAMGASLLFVESAWEGNGGAFRYDLAHFAKRQGSPLRDVLVAADKADLPTVFWNKEDPVHYEDFADAAGQFDWIFTTDADCIERYVKLADHERVAALPFAAQPRLHHPIGAPPQRLARACFAGSWQADNYADRGADVELLLRPVLDAGLLDIFDRMAAPGAHGARFPAPYDQAVLGSRPYAELLDEYRRYACFLNVNSVKTSPTMCSRPRVRAARLPHAGRVDAVACDRRAARRHRDHRGDAGRRTSRRRAADRRRRAPRSCRPARLPRRHVTAHLRPSRRSDPRHAGDRDDPPGTTCHRAGTDQSARVPRPPARQFRPATRGRRPTSSCSPIRIASIVRTSTGDSRRSRVPGRSTSPQG